MTALISQMQHFFSSPTQPAARTSPPTTRLRFYEMGIPARTFFFFFGGGGARAR